MDERVGAIPVYKRYESESEEEWTCGESAVLQLVRLGFCVKVARRVVHKPSRVTTCKTCGVVGRVFTYIVGFDFLFPYGALMTSGCSVECVVADALSTLFVGK